MIFLAVLLFALLSGQVNAEDLPGAVFVSAYDGDTVLMNFSNLPRVFGYHLRVRLAGIDAPEIRGHCAKEIDLAKAARDALATYLRATKLISIQQVSRDEYFRVDAVIVADGVNVNNLLIQQGYAVGYSGSGKRHDWCGP